VDEVEDFVVAQEVDIVVDLEVVEGGFHRIKILTTFHSGILKMDGN